MTLGDRILNYRAEHGLTQAQMAEVLGVYTQMIYRLEAGRNVQKTRQIMLEKAMAKLENQKD